MRKVLLSASATMTVRRSTLRQVLRALRLAKRATVRATGTIATRTWDAAFPEGTRKTQARGRGRTAAMSSVDGGVETDLPWRHERSRKG